MLPTLGWPHHHAELATEQPCAVALWHEAEEVASGVLSGVQQPRSHALVRRIAQRERAEQEAAATSGRIGTEEDLRKAAAKSTPYSAPGGRWASFRSYSVWQRSFMIWGFAIRFFFKLWLVGKKFTYGKKVNIPPRDDEHGNIA